MLFLIYYFTMTTGGVVQQEREYGKYTKSYKQSDVYSIERHGHEIVDLTVKCVRYQNQERAGNVTLHVLLAKYSEEHKVLEAKWSYIDLVSRIERMKDKTFSCKCCQQPFTATSMEFYIDPTSIPKGWTMVHDPGKIPATLILSNEFDGGVTFTLTYFTETDPVIANLMFGEDLMVAARQSDGQENCTEPYINISKPFVKSELKVSESEVVKCGSALSVPEVPERQLARFESKVSTSLSELKISENLSTHSTLASESIQTLAYPRIGPLC